MPVRSVEAADKRLKKMLSRPPRNAKLVEHWSENLWNAQGADPEKPVKLPRPKLLNVRERKE